MTYTVGSARVIVRNVAFLLSGNFGTLALSVPFWMLVPRIIGPGEWGEFSVGTTLTALAVSVGGLGITTFLIKDIARSPERSTAYLRNGLATHFVLSLLMMIGILAFTYVAGYSAHTRSVVMLLLASGVSVFLAAPAISALQALERMHLNAVVVLLRQLAITGSAVPLGLIFHPDVIILIVLILGLNVLATALQLLITNRYVPVGVIFDWSMARRLIVGGLPFWSNGFFLSFYAATGSILLSVLAKTHEVGYYAAAAQVVATLGFLPMVVTTAIFPALSSGYRRDFDQMRRLTRVGLIVLLTFGLPISIGGVLVGPHAIRTVFGPGFGPSGPTMTILALTIVPAYVSTLAYWVLAAADRQRSWVFVMGIAAVANPLLNLILIPYFQAHYGHGSTGAAVALLITDVGICTAGITLMPRACLEPIRPIVVATLRAAVAAAFMAVPVWLLRDRLLPVPVLLGVAVFTLTSLAVGVVRNEGYYEVWAGLRHIVRRRLRLEAEPQQAA